jgi:hypothetical protein
MGPWAFDGFAQGDQITFAQWQNGFTDIHSGDFFQGQDKNSSITP